MCRVSDDMVVEKVQINGSWRPMLHHGTAKRHKAVAGCHSAQGKVYCRNGVVLSSRHWASNNLTVSLTPSPARVCWHPRGVAWDAKPMIKTYSLPVHAQR
jgi:hypothetical protein